MPYREPTLEEEHRAQRVFEIGSLVEFRNDGINISDGFFDQYVGRTAVVIQYMSSGCLWITLPNGEATCAHHSRFIKPKQNFDFSKPDWEI